MEKTLTPKQQKLITLISENLGKTGDTKTLGKMILEAGYSKSMSESPQQILKSHTMRYIMQEFMDELRHKAQMSLSAITPKKLKDASARDNAAIVDTLTKNAELLSGHSTERRAINIEISEAVARKNMQVN